MGRTLSLTAPSAGLSTDPRASGAGVAAAQLLAHLRVRAFPETAQIPRGLDGPPVGRQQRQEHGHPVRADGRRLGRAEQLLQLHRRRHHPIVSIVERGCAGRSAARGGSARAGRARASSRTAAEGPDRCRRADRARQAGGPHQRRQIDLQPGKRQAAAGAARRARFESPRARPRPGSAPPAADRAPVGAPPARGRRSAHAVPHGHDRCAGRARSIVSSAVGASHSGSTRLARRMRASFCRPASAPPRSSATR